MKCVRGVISATTEELGKKIQKVLLEKRLIAGSLITKGNSLHWWKEEIENQDYYVVSMFTMDSKMEEITEVAKEILNEDCPVIFFYDILSMPKDLEEWVKSNVK
jgi:uncharacterized protein involved in tolerance to divalent cations